MISSDDMVERNEFSYFEKALGIAYFRTCIVFCCKKMRTQDDCELVSQSHLNFSCANTMRARHLEAQLVLEEVQYPG
jgi:hypothetical protein